MEPIEKSSKNKQAVIVVGRMGHGKSCFTKMIASQGQKAKIQVSASLKSVTDHCNVYKSQFIQMAEDQQLVIIDTPGMDSTNALYLIIQEIDFRVIEQKLSIIGIIIVLDIRVRDQNKGDKSFLIQFLQMLRIKYNHKLNLTTLILSKFDKYYDEEQDNQIVFKQLSELFRKKGFKKLWDNRICWMSEPQKDKNKYLKNLKDEECKKLHQNQFIKLKEVFRMTKEKKLFLSHQSYKTDLSEFEEKLIEKFKQKYHSFQFSNTKFQFDISVNIQRMGYIQGGIQLLKNIIGKTFTILSPHSILLLPYASLISLFIGYYSHKMDSREISQEDLLTKLINDKLKALIISIAHKAIKITEKKKLSFSKAYDIKIEKALNNDIDLILEQKINQIEIQLKVGKNILTLSSKLPNIHYIESLIQEVSQQYYNQQKQQMILI